MVVDRPWWHPYARCIDQVELFYDPSLQPAVAAALDVCRLCGVRQQCLAEALEEEAGRARVFGVRGGADCSAAASTPARVVLDDGRAC